MNYVKSFEEVINDIANELCIRERIINRRGEEDYIYHCNLKKIRELFREIFIINIGEYLKELNPGETILYTYEFDYEGNTFDEDLETDYIIKIDAATRLYDILALLPEVPDNFDYAFSEPFLLGVTKIHQDGKIVYRSILASKFLSPKIIN